VKKQLLIFSLLILVVFSILEGCKMSTEKTVTKEEQIAFLKKNEAEMTEYVKAQNSKVTSVQWDWESVQTGVGGNGTPQGAGEYMSIKGGFNNKKTDFLAQFSIDSGTKKPYIKSMVASNFIIFENGRWEIYE